MSCIANVNARKFRKNARHLENLKKQFKAPDRLALTGSLPEMRQALVSFKTLGTDTLMVCGGDGTLHFVINELIALWGEETYPKLIVVPAGTMNIVSEALKPASAIRTLRFDAIVSKTLRSELTPTKIGTLSCNGRIGFVFGLGMFARFVEWYSDRRDPSAFRAAWLVGTLVMSALFGGQLAKRMFATFAARVSIDDNIFEMQRFRTLSASTISSVGFGVHLFPDVNLDRHRPLGVFILLGSGLAMAAKLGSFLRKRKAISTQFVQKPAASMEVRTDEALRLMMDGEMFEASRSFDVRMGPTLEVLV